jgi:PAS domain-containing protein
MPEMADKKDVVRASDMANTPPDYPTPAPDWLDRAHDAIILCDMQGKINYWNHGAETLYGWSRQQAVGTLIGELLSSHLPLSLEVIFEELRQKGTWEGELRHRIRPGFVRPAPQWRGICR